MRRLRILTWHTHGSYLLYLTQAPHEFYVLSKPGRPPGYGGVAGHQPWGPNVHDLPAERAKDQAFDLILFQDDPQYLEDQHQLLSAAQRRLPRIYLEHDPPWGDPSETRHIVDDPEVLVVHCTHFNRLMWDSGRSPTRVIEHGVPDPGVRWSGELERGLVIVNHLARRGRRLGADLFEQARRQVPLDLAGMGAEELGGIGEVLLGELPAFAARYRFLFNPIRYTSLGLAVLEAMMIGLPVVALATTEMPTVIRDGENGFISCDPRLLLDRMRYLLRKPQEARRLGREARRTALERFGIGRFAADWDRAFRETTGLRNERFVA
jgi:hypothetical protein